MNHKRVWAFDNRTGAINEQVTLGRKPKTPTQAGHGEFHHPRIEWRAGEVKKAATLSAPQPVPTSEAERWRRLGGSYLVASIVFAGDNNSVYAKVDAYDG